MANEQISLGDYIRSLREAKGLSQRELAEKSGLSNAEISRMESGERKKPSITTIRAVSPHLGIGYTDLLLQAGYIDSIASDAVTNAYLDSSSAPIDIVSLAKDVYRVDPDLMKTVKSAAVNATQADIAMIKKFLSIFAQSDYSRDDKSLLFALLDKFLV